jgi:hypothetical protein
MPESLALTQVAQSQAGVSRGHLVRRQELRKECARLLARWLHYHHWQERECRIVGLDCSLVMIALQWQV